MKMKNLCNNIYKDLLAKLGELTLQKNVIDKQIKDIQAQLNLLNGLSPELQKVEKELSEDK